MKKRTSNFLSIGFALAASFSFVAAAGLYYGFFSRLAHLDNRSFYIHFVGIGMLLTFIAVLPRFATLVFNITDRSIISQKSAVRLDNWFVIDELRRNNNDG